MGKYVENNLNRNETVTRRAILSIANIIILWVLFIATILVTVIVPKMIVNSWLDKAEDATEGSFAATLIEGFSDEIDFDLEDAIDQVAAKIVSVIRKPFYFFNVLFGILAITETFRFLFTELAFTNKRVIGKTGVFSSRALDATLEKIDSVATSSGLFGKIFGYGKISIRTAADRFDFKYVKRPEEFKRALMAQIDKAEQDRLIEQTKAMAAAVASSNSTDA